jgi:hypothetical protein
MNRQAARAAAQLGCIIFLLFMIAPWAQAQHVVSAKAALIQHTVGSVLLDGDVLNLSKSEYVQMREGQTLLTARGRAELLLAPGVYLRLGESSRLRLFQGELDDTQLALDRGTALIEVVDLEKGNKIRMQFEGGLIEFKKRGLYRLDAADDMLRVYGGEARVAFRSKRAKVKKGKMVILKEDLKPQKFDVDDADTIHRWAAARSFELFSETPLSVRQPHWTHISMGWLMNNNYRVRIYSRNYYDAWMNMQRYGYRFPTGTAGAYGIQGTMNAAAAAAARSAARSAAAAAAQSAGAAQSGAAAQSSSGSRSSGSSNSSSWRSMRRE